MLLARVWRSSQNLKDYASNYTHHNKMVSLKELICIIFEVAHCMMHQQPKLSLRFWVEYVNTLAYIKSLNPHMFFQYNDRKRGMKWEKAFIEYFCIFG
jgi:hypothetical protein